MNSSSTRATRRAACTSAATRRCSRPAYGSPFIHNLDEGRRYARIEDFRNFVKLAYMANSLHHSGGTICEPSTCRSTSGTSTWSTATSSTATRRSWARSRIPDRAADSVELANIAFGGEAIDPLTGRPQTRLISLINVNSPLTYDSTMLGALKVYARANQATIITPFILSGAMSPVTVAGTAAQTLAEALAGMAFAQVVNPGAPVVFGSFASSLSMQSGAPTFGTP
jgi:trimethylamine--corrinoid protein Co-methyltransferase